LYTLAVLVRPRLALRTWIIVIASYVFYAQWDYRFTALLFFTSALDFSVARLLDISRSLRQRRALLATSIILNLGVLAVFKYFNFFRESLQVLLASFGLDYHWKIWMIALPVGPYGYFTPGNHLNLMGQKFFTAKLAQELARCSEQIGQIQPPSAESH
jgi:D-alanyl-lipoteichoic acid acyltransferase DltB (MBOAT superfamily)